MYTAFLSDAKCLNSFFLLLFKLVKKCVITGSLAVCCTKDDEIPIKKNVYNISRIKLYILTTDLWILLVLFHPWDHRYIVFPHIVSTSEEDLYSFLCRVMRNGILLKKQDTLCIFYARLTSFIF